MAYLDDFGRFDLTEPEREALRAVWNSPERDLLLKTANQARMHLLGRLRECPKEEIDLVRGELTGLEVFFTLLGKSTKTDEELLREIQDASPGVGRVSPAI